MLHHPRYRFASCFVVALASLCGCRGATICDQAWSTSGQLTRSKNSDAYVALMARADSDVPHVACRAETTIEVARLLWQESSSAQFKRVGGGPQSAYDPRVQMVTKAINSVQGRYRILGVGRGVDAADCASAALYACNEAIDRYWAKELGSRPLGVPCVLVDDTERCPGPGGSFEPVALASVEPEVAPRSEPPLVTLVKKLDDPRSRRDAVGGLAQFFENAKTRSAGDVGNPAVKTLLDQIMEPLAKTYADEDLDDKTRVKLIRLLGEAHDERAGRAWIKAFASASKGMPGAEEDVQWAALGIASTHFEEAAAAMGDALGKVDLGKPEAAEARENVRAAMLELKSPAWKTTLVERLRKPMPKDDDAAARRNEIFWQTTAADVLGELGDSDATQPLLEVIADPDKTDMAPAALRAITRIAQGGKLPSGAEVEKTFQSALEKLTTSNSPKGVTRAELLDVAAGFSDPDLVPWLLKQVKAAKGPDADDVRTAGLRAATKLMRRAQVPAVRAVVDKLGTDTLKDAFREASRSVAK